MSYRITRPENKHVNSYMKHTDLMYSGLLDCLRKHFLPLFVNETVMRDSVALS